MSINKTAAEMLLKLAQDLEKEAAEKTIFACSGCGGSHTMAAINDAIAKFAEENPDVDTSNAKVTVNDTVSCPNCGNEMEYAPTAESEQYYVSEDTEGDEDDNKKEQETEKDAALNLDKVTKMLSQVSKPVIKQIKDMAAREKLNPSVDHPHSVDKHQGIDFSLDKEFELTPAEKAQAEQLQSKLKSASDFEEHDAAGLGSMSAKVIFSVLLAAALASAGGNKSKAFSALDSVIQKADTFIQQGADKGTPDLKDYTQTHIDPTTGNPVHTTVHAPGAGNTSTGPSTAQAPTSPTMGHNASIEEIVKKASSDPKINVDKLARYLA